MATIEDLVVGIGVDAGDLDKQVSDASSRFESAMGKITLAGAAAGAGLEAFARSQADSNAQTLCKLHRVSSACTTSELANNVHNTTNSCCQCRDNCRSSASAWVLPSRRFCKN